MPTSFLLLFRTLLHFGIFSRWSVAEDARANSDFVAALLDRTLEIGAHAHAQLQIFLGNAQLLSNAVPSLSKALEILIFSLSSSSFASGNGANSHKTT